MSPERRHRISIKTKAKHLRFKSLETWSPGAIFCEPSLSLDAYTTIL
jgi:hypothetical protein